MSTLGTGNDLTYAYDGTDTTITFSAGNFTLDNTNTSGSVVVQLGSDTTATAFQVKNNSGGNLFEIQADGSSSGISGNWVFTGNNAGLTSNPDIIQLAAGSITFTENTLYGDDVASVWGNGNDLTINHSTDNIIASNAGDLIIENNNATGQTLIKLGTADANTQFVVTDSTTTDKLTVDGSGRVSIGTGPLTLPDNVELQIGDLPDLTIAHNGINSVITSTTGNLLVDNTSATGATIVQLGTDDSFTAFQITNSSGDNLFKVQGDGTITPADPTIGNWVFTGNAAGLSGDLDLLTLATNQATIAGNLDVTLGLNVTGAALTTAAGSTNTAGTVLLSGGSLKLNDNITANFGGGNDLQIAYTGSASTIFSLNGDLLITNNDANGDIIMKLGDTDTSSVFRINDDGNNTILRAWPGGTVNLLDNIHLTIGTVDDLDIVHDGSNSVITSKVGNLTIDNTNATGETIVQLGTDTNTTSFIVKNDSGGTLLEVMGDGTIATLRAINDTGVTVAIGALVVLEGADAGTNLSKMVLATKNDFTTLDKAKNVYMVSQQLLDGVSGTIIQTGIVTSLNTNGMTLGDVLYLGDDGAFVNAEPSYPDTITRIGIVNKVGTSDGEVFFFQDFPERYQFANTGWLTGYTMTINADPTKLDFAAGIGIVVDNITPSDPITNIVVVSAPQTVTGTNFGIGQTITHFNVNKNNVFLQEDTFPDYITRRSHFYIGNVNHTPSGFAFDPANIFNVPRPTWGGLGMLNDISYAAGGITLSGLSFSAAATGMAIQHTAGVGTRFGGIPANNNYPETHDIPGINPVTSFSRSFVNASGNVDFSTYSTLDPDQYQVPFSGVLTAVPATQYTNQYLFVFPGSNFVVVFYGPHPYVSLDAATANALTEPFFEHSDIIPAVFRGWLTIQQGLTGNLTDHIASGHAIFTEAGYVREGNFTGKGRFLQPSTIVQLSDANNQKPGTTTPTLITFDTNDSISGSLEHSTSVEPGDIKATVAGNYVFVAQPQCERTSGSGGTISFHCWARKGRRTGIITNVSITNPSVITSANHRIPTGETITISNTTTTPTINGAQVITVIDANTFSIPVNVTAVSDEVGDWTRLLTMADDVANSNVELNLLKSTSQSDVIPLFINIFLNEEDIIQFYQSVSNATKGRGLVAKTPAGEPAIPSIILVGNLV